MQYMGGKYRIARHIESLVLAARGGRSEYVEPFLGGGATFSKIAPHFEEARGYDVVPDLVLMWQAVLEGWVPPGSVSEDEYRALRDAEPSALRGFVGFGCSFGGKWFGGYARAHKGAAPGYNYADGASRNLVKQVKQMGSSRVEVADYRDLSISANAVVYADPPYVGTTQYGAAGGFDTDEFWRIARGWVSTGAAVLVSEHVAPGDWECVWAKAGPTYMRGDQLPDARIERVFTTPEAAEQIRNAI